MLKSNRWLQSHRTLSRFERWFREGAHGRLLDPKVELKRTTAGHFGVFAKESLAPGDLFAVIPQSSCIQTSSGLRLIALDVLSRQDPAAGSAGFLAVLPIHAMEKYCTDVTRRVQEVLTDPQFSDWLKGDSMGVRVQWATLAIVIAAMRRRLEAQDRTETFCDDPVTLKFIEPYVLDCLGSLPGPSPLPPVAALVTKAEESFQLYPAWKECNRLLAVRRALAKSLETRVTDASWLAPLRLNAEDDLLWGMHMVDSRANMFSFEGSTDDLRPYGIFGGGAPPGAEPTLCPVFDMMNHVPLAKTNVVVSDTLVKVRAAYGGGAKAEEKPLVPTPGIVLGTLRSVAAGEEVGYCYNYLPDATKAATDAAWIHCMARWGFVPS